MSLLDTIKEEVELIAGFRTDEVLKLIEQNRVRGRIWLLRRHKAYPVNELEQQYMQVLNLYVHYKIKRGRRDFRVPWSTVEQYRGQMTELEAQMRGEIAEWDSNTGFLFSGHFSQ